MRVYEKATRMAWWLQGPIALRELLWYLCLESSAKYNVLVAEHDDAGSLYKVYAVSYECLGLYLE
jgi:hypothetical protein